MSGKSPSQSTHGDDNPSPSPGPRDLGPRSRVYNAHGTDSELTNVRSFSPIMAARAIKRCVEGNPKSTEDNAPQVSKFYHVRRVSILSLTNKCSQLTRE